MPHTREEKKNWAKDMVAKIFHGHKKEKVIDGFVARDENGSLAVFTVEPIKLPCAPCYKHGHWTSSWNNPILRLKDTEFPSVKWEDEKATPCSITIKIE